MSSTDAKALESAARFRTIDVDSFEDACRAALDEIARLRRKMMTAVAPWDFHHEMIPPLDRIADALRLIGYVEDDLIFQAKETIGMLLALADCEFRRLRKIRRKPGPIPGSMWAFTMLLPLNVARSELERFCESVREVKRLHRDECGVPALKG